MTDSIKKNYIFYFTALSLLICTYFSGGYNWYHCIMPVILLLFVTLLNIKKIINNKFCVVLFILIVFTMPGIIFTLADKQNAIYEAEKLICLILAFYSGSMLEEEKINYIVWISAVFCAVLGILGYCNLIRVNEFVFNDRTFARLQSCIRYANTTAVVLGAGYFSLLGQYVQTGKKRFSYLGCICLTAMYLTISKAEIPIFLLIGTLLIIKNKKYSKSFIYNNTVCILICLMTVLAARNHLYAVSIMLVISCVIIAAKPLGNEKILYALWSGAAILMIFSIILFVLYSKIDLFLSLTTRFQYMRDSLPLLKNHLLFGIGTGGWNYYQYSVQTIAYTVRFIHNGYLQLLVENGIIFTAFFVFLIFYALVISIKNKKHIFACILLLITLHSIIDVDLSYGLILMILGIVTGNILKESSADWVKVFSSIILIICGVTVLYMSAEYIVRTKFEQEYLNGNYNKSLTYALKLEKLCPYDSNLQLSISSLSKEGKEQRLKKAVLLSPLDHTVFENYLKFEVNNKNADIVNLCKKYIELAPKQEKTYTTVFSIAKDAFEKGSISENEYNSLLDYLQARLKKENVIDRNKLLKQIQ